MEIVSPKSVKLTNKLDCPVIFSYKVPDDLSLGPIYDSLTAPIAKDSSVIIIFKDCGEFRARPLATPCSSVCSGLSANTCNVLPVLIGNAAATIENGYLVVRFVALDQTNVKNYNLHYKVGNRIVNIPINLADVRPGVVTIKKIKL